MTGGEAAEVADTALGPPLLGALMRRPWEAMQRMIYDGVHAAGFTDVTRAHLQVLRWPGPQGRRPSEVAAELGMTKQALNYLLRQLEDAGYLERREGAADGRTRTIELTPRGVELAMTLRSVVSDVEDGLRKEIGAAALDDLLDLLRRFNATDIVANALAIGR